MNGKLLRVIFKLFDNFTFTFEDSEEKNPATNALVAYNDSKLEDKLITVPNPDNEDELIMFYPHSVVAVNVEDGGEPVEYVTITYADPDGKAENLPDPVEVRKNSRLTDALIPDITTTDANFRFDGWWDSTNTEKYESGDVLSSDITLYAKWFDTRITTGVEIKYADPEGHASRMPLPMANWDYPHSITSVDLNPARPQEGYEFAGWWNKHYTRQYQVGDLLYQTTILYAKWNVVPITRTVHYEDVDGYAIAVPFDITVDDGHALTASELPVLDSNTEWVTFESWQKDLVDVEPGYIVNSNITLTAHWNVGTPVRIRYTDTEMRSADPMPHTKQVAVGHLITAEELPSLNATDPRYTFVGWSIDGGATLVAVGDAITADTSLNAVWSRTVEITYVDPDGKSADPIPTTKTVEEGYELVATDIPALTATDPIRYTFLGWSTSELEEDIVSVGDVINDNTMLTAVWEDNFVNIYYSDLSGYAVEVPPMKSVEAGHVLTEADLPSLVSGDMFKAFAGWFNNDETIQYHIGDTITESTNMYAKFVDAIIIAYIDMEGISPEGRDRKFVAPGHVLTAEDVAPLTTDKAYTFDKWTNFDKSVTYSVGDIINDSTDMYANWTPADAVIKYVDPSGFATSLPSQKTVNAGYQLQPEDLASIDTTQPYKFVGWFNASYENQYNRGYRVQNNISLYAKWEPKAVVEIKYADPSGVADFMPPNKTDYEGYELTEADIPEITTSIPELIFAGWYNDDNSRRYEPGDVINTTTILYAVFRPTIHIIYKDETGIAFDHPMPREVAFRHYVSADDLPFIRSNYDDKIFAGWFNQDGTHRYEVGEFMDSIDDVTLYAHFVDKEEITIYFYAGHEAAELRHLFDRTWYKDAPVTQEIIEGFEPYYTADGMKHTFVKWTSQDEAIEYKYGDTFSASVSMYGTETVDGPYDVVQVHYDSEATVELPDDIYVLRGSALTASMLVPKVYEQNIPDTHDKLVFRFWSNSTTYTDFAYREGYVVNSDITMYALYETVAQSMIYVQLIDEKLVMHDESFIIKELFVEPNYELTWEDMMPLEPPRGDVHVFQRWRYSNYSDARAGDRVTENTVIYAEWNGIPDKIMLSFIDESGLATDLPPAWMCDYKQLIQVLPMLTSSDPTMKFEGWYNADYTVKQGIPFKLINYTTLYAKFIGVNDVTISYMDADYGNTVPVKSVAIGMPIDNSYLPKFDDISVGSDKMVHVGWFDISRTVKYEVGNMFDRNTTFYAKWELVSGLTITYKDPTGYATWTPERKEHLAVPYTITSADIPRPGSNNPDKVFDYWSKDGVRVNVGDVFSDSGEITFDANFKDKPAALTFTAVEPNSSVTFSTGGRPTEYSTDGINWNSYTSGTEIALSNVGDYVMFKSTGSTTGRRFSMTGKIEASGSVQSLLGDDMSIPAYFYSLFGGCTSLVTAPELPAMNLAEKCYVRMFSECTSLVNAPELPAMNLAYQCYYGMFTGCTSLVEAPELPATNLAASCYNNMFNGCSSLIEAPELPATNLAASCYTGMFTGCTSLVEAPELPATNLAGYCYNGMFSGCTSLNRIKCHFTTWHGTNSTLDWVANVGANGTFVCPTDLPEERGISSIPNGWTIERF